MRLSTLAIEFGAASSGGNRLGDLHLERDGRRRSRVNLGPTELIIILAIILLLFGARKLPNLARSLGKSSKEFKRGLEEEDREEAPTDASASSKPEERPEP
jgi:sec-independent protein translocase protein TatA